MADVVAEKALQDGEMLQIRRYSIERDVSKYAGRPVVEERVIHMMIGQGCGAATNPMASWFVSEGQLQMLYNRISNQDQFFMVSDLLGGVKCAEDVKQVDSFLETLQ